MNFGICPYKFVESDDSTIFIKKINL